MGAKSLNRVFGKLFDQQEVIAQAIRLCSKEIQKAGVRRDRVVRIYVLQKQSVLPHNLIDWIIPFQNWIKKPLSLRQITRPKLKGGEKKWTNPSIQPTNR